MGNVTEQSELMAALSPEKRELSHSNLHERTPQSGTVPLSCAQQHVLFAHQADPLGAAYNLPVDISYSRPFDISALTAALNELVRRHDSLRTVFPITDGKPFQFVLPHLSLDLPILDFSSLPSRFRDPVAMRAAESLARIPFDLACDRPFRPTLLRLSDDNDVLLCVLHQIICDSWSVRVFLKKFNSLYQSFCQERLPCLAPLTLQYTDFALWQHNNSPDFSSDLSYWRKQLSSLTPVDLPPDLLRNDRHSASPCACIEFSWSAETASDLARFSLAESVTPFMTLLAVFQCLLLRYTNRRDIAVGTSVAGRNHLETANVIGSFANQIVLRTRLQPHFSFRHLLGSVRETVLEAYAHQNLPFSKLVADLAPGREADPMPFFRLELVTRDLPDSRSSLDGMDEPRWRLNNFAAKLDITLAFHLGVGSLGGTLEYAADLYSRARVENLLSHFRSLIIDAMANPDKRLDELALIDDRQREQLLEWSRGPRALNPRLCLHEMFSLQVDRSRDATALLADGAKLTYAQVEAQANQLAHYLKRSGVGPEVRVGIYLARSPAQFVAMLAILKAGGAYVPLDPDYPRQRLHELIEDEQLVLIVTDLSLAELLPSKRGRAICLDADRPAMAAEPTCAPPSDVLPDNVAYVIYTSGSTGRPKGVAISHRGAVNLAMAQVTHFGIGPDKTVAQVSSIGFDASVSEWVTALLSGATLAIGTREEVAPGGPLADFLDRHRVSVVTLPPTILMKMPEGRLETIETLVVAGEACPRQLVERWGAARRMLNGYGPTETSVCATISGSLQPHRRISIGNPIQNVDVYILDERLRLVPMGVAGDIYIAGEGLAHGYQGRPELTAAAFIPNPYGSAGERIYKTGDRGRWLADAEIEYLGRSDEQIKINGCRVEPGEIISTLMSYPGVKEVAVKVWQRNGNPSLAAYVSAETGDSQVSERGAEFWPAVESYPAFDEALCSAMDNDRELLSSYRRTIEAAAAGRVVLNIGTGLNAALARLCIEAGAKRVYAIELAEEAYEKVKGLVKSLGLEDRLVVLQGDVAEAGVPEKADMCVSWLVGGIASSKGIVTILNKARGLLKAGARMIPARAVTHVACVRLPEELHKDPAMKGVSAYYTEEVFRQVGRRFDLRVCIRNMPKECVVSDAGLFEELDFTGEIEEEESRKIKLTIKESGRIDGFLLWLGLQTGEGEEVNILERRHTWLPVYFPTFYPGIEVKTGDIVEGVCIRRPCTENMRNPDYLMEGQVIPLEGKKKYYRHRSANYGSVYEGTEFYERMFEGGAETDKKKTRGVEVVKLRQYLGERLPGYMMPQRIVMMEGLPLTSSGKIDVRALPEPKDIGPDGKNYYGPRTPLEETLCDIWEEVLGIQPIGIDQNFFELGGDSILSIQVVIRSNQAGIRISIRDLFQHQCIASLAQAAASHNPLPSGGAQGRQPPTIAG